VLRADLTAEAHGSSLLQLPDRRDLHARPALLQSQRVQLDDRGRETLAQTALVELVLGSHAAGRYCPTRDAADGVAYARDMPGIVSYGAYLPYWRLQRRAISATLGAGTGQGTRSVASYDEDTTSMGVEAARQALAGAPTGWSASMLMFATTAPAYADKTNATAIHAALDLSPAVPAFDAVGAVRSGVGATLAAASAGGLAVLADVRTGRPGSADESAGGDGAVALAFGDDGAIAEIIGSASVSAEFVDRWRTPGASYSRVWEERFGEHAYVPLATDAIEGAVKAARVTLDDVDHAVVTGLHARAVKAAAKAAGIRTDTLADDLAASVGNTGTAHWALMLADVLDRARAGQVVLVAVLADGCDAWVLRVTDAIDDHRDRHGALVRDRIAATRDDLQYAQFLTWRGFLEQEPPRRPEPDRPASPPSLRTDRWKYALVGSRDETGFVHLPPARVSMGTGGIDRMEPVRMADTQATIATFTVDHLAFSLSPPVVAAVIDFDGGGRFQCELTDIDPDALRIGDRVEMTFRRLYTVDGIHDYFWKAKPVTSADQPGVASDML
jgi:hydroxymethylglutaryl-CoA synthase